MLLTRTPLMWPVMCLSVRFLTKGPGSDQVAAMLVTFSFFNQWLVTYLMLITFRWLCWAVDDLKMMWMSQSLNGVTSHQTSSKRKCSRETHITPVPPDTCYDTHSPSPLALDSTAVHRWCNRGDSRKGLNVASATLPLGSEHKQTIVGTVSAGNSWTSALRWWQDQLWPKAVLSSVGMMDECADKPGERAGTRGHFLNFHWVVPQWFTHVLIKL